MSRRRKIRKNKTIWPLNFNYQTDEYTKSISIFRQCELSFFHIENLNITVTNASFYTYKHCERIEINVANLVSVKTLLLHLIIMNAILCKIKPYTLHADCIIAYIYCKSAAIAYICYRAIYIFEIKSKNKFIWKFLLFRNFVLCAMLIFIFSVEFSTFMDFFFSLRPPNLSRVTDLITTISAWNALLSI